MSLSRREAFTLALVPVVGPQTSTNWLHLIPLWCLVSLVLIVARRFLVRGTRSGLVAAIATMMLPGAVLGYLLATRWRPTPMDVFMFFGLGLISELISRLISPRRPELAADLAQRGREQEAALRSVLMRSGVVLAASALALARVDVRLALGLEAAIGIWCLGSLLPFLRTVESGVSITIGRPPEEVFDFVADARNQPWYEPSVESVEAQTLGSPRVGSRFLVRLWDGTEGIEEILEYDRPRRFASGLPDAPQDNRSIWTFQPALGGTRVRYSYRFRLTTWQALSGMWLMQLWLRPLQNSGRRSWLRRLKAVLEAGTATSGRDELSA